MSEMIERVARTLQAHDDAFAEGEPTDPCFLIEARAVLDAMRDPTEAMVDAANAKDRHIRKTCNGVRAGWDDGWQAMIDAALKDDG